MSLFFVDSSCDLSAQQIKSLGIECLNIPYEINEQSKEFDENFDFDKFYSKLRKGIVLTSAGLSEDDYLSLFSPVLEGGDDIVYVYSSGGVFDCKPLHSAQQLLKSTYPDREIQFIDSKNISVGCGAVCYELAKMYHNGASIGEIVDKAQSLIDCVATYLIVDSLESLTLTGVIDSSVAVGSTLNIKYLIAVDIDGRCKLIDKVTGKKRAISKLIQIVRQTGRNVADNPVFVGVSGVVGEIELLTSKLKEYFGEELELHNNKITPSNCVVVGKEAIALSFRTNKKTH